jgi:hypothetical protein
VVASYHYPLRKITRESETDKPNNYYLQSFNVLSYPLVTTPSFKTSIPITFPSCPRRVDNSFQSRVDHSFPVPSNELDERYSPLLAAFAKRICVIRFEWAGIDAACFRRRRSQILIVPSSPEVASWNPLGLNSEQSTRFAWPC